MLDLYTFWIPLSSINVIRALKSVMIFAVTADLPMEMKMEIVLSPNDHLLMSNKES
jgi:hypothetical protein